jgi:hypothetical protein
LHPDPQAFSDRISESKLNNDDALVLQPSERAVQYNPFTGEPPGPT